MQRLSKAMESDDSGSPKNQREEIAPFEFAAINEEREEQDDIHILFDGPRKINKEKRARNSF